VDAVGTEDCRFLRATRKRQRLCRGPDDDPGNDHRVIQVPAAPAAPRISPMMAWTRSPLPAPEPRRDCTRPLTQPLTADHRGFGFPSGAYFARIFWSSSISLTSSTFPAAAHVIQGWSQPPTYVSASLISCWAFWACFNSNSIFDCPEQTQTSPTRMSATFSEFLPVTVNSCGPTC